MKAEKMRWIPVTEALPEKRKMVLMYYGDGTMTVGYVLEIHEDWGIWYAGNIEAPDTTLVCDPDFWMPLPEPPEVEN